MKKNILLFTVIPFFFFTSRLYSQLNNAFGLTGGVQWAADLGAQWHSLEIHWRNVQPNTTTPVSNWNWSGIDQKVVALQTQGVNVYLTLRCSNPVAPGPQSYCSVNWGANGIYDSWYPDSLALWDAFVTEAVHRYDLSFTSPHPAGLISSVNHWHIEQEWQVNWCVDTAIYPDQDSFDIAQSYVQYINHTAALIHSVQSSAVVSAAGMDGRHNTVAFSDGYFSSNQICINNACNGTGQNFPQSAFATSQFQRKRRNTLYILQNQNVDEVDIHRYGRWIEIDTVLAYLRDSSGMNNTTPITFMEGGGPACKTCEQNYHTGSDTMGYLSGPLIRDNASYMVYYIITGLAGQVQHLYWHVSPEYTTWGNEFGDMDMMTINYVKKPSYYIYRFLAKTVFSRTDANSVTRIPESNPALYHYIIQPMGLHVIWSTNTNDSYQVNGTDTLYQWNIPTGCTDFSVACDSVVVQTSTYVNGNYTISLTNGVPVFFGWGNVLSVNELQNSITARTSPNPFVDATKIYLTGVPANEKCDLQLYNSTGELVRETVFAGTQYEIQRGNLPAGIYFFRIISMKGAVASGKIVAQ